MPSTLSPVVNTNTHEEMMHKLAELTLGRTKRSFPHEGNVDQSIPRSEKRKWHHNKKASRSISNGFGEFEGFHRRISRDEPIRKRFC